MKFCLNEPTTWTLQFNVLRKYSNESFNEKDLFYTKKTNQNNLIEIHDILQDQSNDIVQS